MMPIYIQWNYCADAEGGPRQNNSEKKNERANPNGVLISNAGKATQPCKNYSDHMATRDMW